MLSYFDVRIGPRIFLKGPEDFNEEGIELIPILMHLYETGFFVHIFGDYHSANLIFEIPSVSLRGNQERLLLTILNTGGSIDPQYSRKFLEDFEEKLKELKDAYRAFYYRESKDYQNVSDLFDSFYQSISQKELVKPEKKYTIVSDYAHEMISIVNLKGRYEYLNEYPHKKYLGYSREDLIGKSILKIVHPDYTNQALEAGKRCSEHGESTVELKVRHKNGTYKWIEVKSSNFLDKDVEQKTILVSSEITERKLAEEKLRESEEKYRFISENANDLIAVINTKFEIEYANEQGLTKILGYSAKDLTNKSILEVVHPDYLNQCFEALKDGVQKGEGLVEAKAIHKEGHHLWIEARGSSFKDKNGVVMGLLIARDITERKLTEEKLKESEEKFRTITEQGLMGVAILQGDVFKYVNQQIANIFGYSTADLKSMPPGGFVELVYQEDRLYAIEQARRKQIGEENIIPHYQFRGVKKSGEVIWIEIHSRTINYKGDTADLITLIDITASKEAEQKIKESEEKYRLISENTNDLIVILAENFNVEYINEQTWYRILRYKIEDFIGISPLQLLHPEDAKEAMKAFKNGFAEGLGSMELRIKSKNGDYIWFDLIGRTFIDSNNEKKAVITARDISGKKTSEQRIKESEHKYRLISENANDLISVVDFKFKFEYVNEDAFIKLLGYSEEELIGSPAWKLVHPDDFNSFVSSLRGLGIIGENETELRIKAKNGEYKWFHAVGNKFIDIKNEKKILLVSREITERKLAEDKLKESEEQFRHLFESSPYAIWLINQNNTLIDCNNATNNFLSQYKKEDLIGRDAVEVLSLFKGIEKFQRVFKRALKAMWQGILPKPFEFKLIKANGDIVWVHTECSLVNLEKVTLIQFIIQDITEQKQAEQELMESEERYRSIINNITDAIGEINFHGRYTYLSPQSFDIFGYNPEELIGSNMYKQVHPEDMPVLVENLKRAYNSKENLNMEYRVLHKDGSYISCSTRGSFVNIKGEERFIGSIRDISERKKMEEEIKESEEKYRLISENSTDLIALCNEKLEIEYINEDALRKVLGYSSDKFIGRNKFDLVFPSDLKEGLRKIRKATEAGEGSVDLRYKTKKGNYIWLEFYGKTYFDTEGKKKYLLIARDVNERKIAEQKIKQEQNQMQILIDNLPDAIYFKDEKSRFVLGNKKCAKLMGANSPEELIGKSDFDFFPKNVAEQYHNDERALFQTGKPLLNREEVIMNMADKTKGWGLTSKIPLLNEVGETIGLVGIGRDITERKESEKKYRQMIEESPFGILIFDLSGRLVDCNPMALETLGYSKAALIGQTILNFLKNTNIESFTKIQERIIQVLEGNTTKPESFYFKKKDGKPFWANVTSSLIKSAEQKYVQLLIQDISEQKIAEEKLKESEEKFRKAYALANLYKDIFTHDINNILQNILSSAELYKEMEGPQVKTDFFKMIKEQVKRGTNLALNVHKISPLDESGQEVRKMEVFDVLQNAIDYLLYTYIERDIKVNLNLHNDETFVRANELLVEIFENLLTNAVHHNDKPVVQIDIKTSLIQESGTNYLKMEFMDNGKGIPENEKYEVFKGGYKRDPEARGLGLGLSLVRMLLNNYNGRILVEDKVAGDISQGTNFVVLIPEAA